MDLPGHLSSQFITKFISYVVRCMLYRSLDASLVIGSVSYVCFDESFLM